MTDRESRADDEALLERLADLHAGVLDDAQAARLRAEVATDDHATALLDSLEHARLRFAALGDDDAYLDGLDDPDVGPMPADVVARIDAAIAGETRDRGDRYRANGAGTGESLVPPGSAPSPAAPSPAGAPPVEPSPAGESGPGSPAPVHGLRRRVPVLALAAAVVVLLAGVVAAVVGVPAGTDPPAGDPTTIATGVAVPGRNNVVSPDGRFLYLSNSSPRQIVIIGLREPLRRAVAVPGEVEGMTAGADGRLWVSTTGPGPDGARPEGTLSEIGPATGAVERTSRSGGRAGAVSMSPDGTLLWSVDDRVAFVDPDDVAPFASVGIGGRADQLDVVDDGARLFANVSGFVVGIDLVTRTEVDRYRIPDRTGPLRLAVNPERPLLAVSSNTPDTVALFARGGEAPLATIPIGPSATMTWPRDGSQLYFTSATSAEVGAVRIDDLREVERLPVPPNPRDIVSSPDGSAVYVVYPDEVVVLPR